MKKLQLIHRRNLGPAQMGCNIAAIADTTTDTTYRDIVWKVRDAFINYANAHRRQAYYARRDGYRFPVPPVEHAT